jgi:hypothetical protein
MDSIWYDIGGMPPGKGPDVLEFTSILRRTVNVAHSTWERPAARFLECAVSSSESLLDVLRDPEPNKRIVAAKVLGQAGHLLTDQSRPRVVEELVRLLADGSPNQIGYGAWQDDEETVVFVSATAAESLKELDYAPNVPTVFARARQEGQPVVERRNKHW